MRLNAVIDIVVLAECSSFAQNKAKDLKVYIQKSNAEVEITDVLTDTQKNTIIEAMIDHHPNTRDIA